MMMKRLLICFSILSVLGYYSVQVSGQPKKPNSEQNMEPKRNINAPPIKMITPGIFEMGGVQIDKNEGRIEFNAVVNMQKGLIEYLLVGDSGKSYESLLRTSVEPYSIQIALLLMGLEGTNHPLAGQGDPRKPEGDPVRIKIKMDNKGKIEELPIEQWIFDKQDMAPLKPMDWIFTGSFINNGVFMAQVEKSIVAVFHDPAAIIDNPLPEGASDEIWFVNEKAVPQPGTEVTVIIEKIK